MTRLSAQRMDQTSPLNTGHHITQPSTHWTIRLYRRECLNPVRPLRASPRTLRYPPREIVLQPSCPVRPMILQHHPT
ncbi:hypothetical protein G647_02401 [Cladophialophora carrionii CBS 160.54]|uniref:Uncharacterized protein n=1 Tax=Cladophialophora carrionii CBS 160.54 TaxID=1279043 RepID=V9DI45_9EURO|nr:uncharacterized protein G647_02401 [Cladophialophora carrionii CBS 160.54]ETI25627.1 hypothetical protein G647_02401 [Cladophialophora carrionii CBS 160.54]